MREVMQIVGRSLAPANGLREMLHPMRGLLGQNRGHMVLTDEGTGGRCTLLERS